MARKKRRNLTNPAYSRGWKGIWDNITDMPRDFSQATRNVKHDVIRAYDPTYRDPKAWPDSNKRNDPVGWESKRLRDERRKELENTVIELSTIGLALGLPAPGLGKAGSRALSAYGRYRSRKGRPSRLGGYQYHSSRSKYSTGSNYSRTASRSGAGKYRR